MTELVPLNMGVPQIAHAFAASGLFKDATDEAKAITKIIAGRALGLDPFSSMSGIHVMQGKVEVGAHVIAAAIKNSGKYDYRVKTKTDTVCRIEFRERCGDGWEVLGVEEFTTADADRADLARNPNWKKHPKSMLFARTISSGYRTHCPDVFLTPVYAEGELGDEPAPVKVVKNLAKPGMAPVAESVQQIRAQIAAAEEPPEEPAYDSATWEALAHSLADYEEVVGVSAGSKRARVLLEEGRDEDKAKTATAWLRGELAKVQADDDMPELAEGVEVA